MPTMIILSSSPPPIFARSPTPADLATPRNTTNTNFNDETPSRKRFKSVAAQRDGFSGSFSTARQVLAEKNGELNKIISSSPGRNKFKAAQNLDSTVSKTANHDLECPSGLFGEDNTLEVLGERDRGADSTGAWVDRREESQTSSPLIVQRAISRRKDWTPPPSDTTQNATDASGFPTNLLADFGYNSTATSTSAFVAGSDTNKRRKLLSADANIKAASMVQGEGAQGQTGQHATIKRNKSPAKKSLTITGLATANYIRNDNVEDSSILQYLTSNQKQVAGDTGMFETKVKETKAAVAKIRQSKKSLPKSMLVSPSSALKSLEAQETVFGSASQLWTAEPKAAANRTNPSDPFSFSDPPSSPLLSQANSIEETLQKTGISRFRQSRNLWAAAGRDEDNALLHVETIDLTESPNVRAALTGKDVMVQPSTKHLRITPSALAPPMPQPSLQQKRPSILDIDDIVIPGQSPSVPSVSFHTTTQNISPRRRKSPALAIDNNEASTATVPKASKPTTKKSQPRKPHFAGLSDHDLKKQISAYGFKAIRSREKMVDLLEKCWVEKNGSNEQPADSEAAKSEYGDILSHVHDVSARPVPKVKKVAKPRKKKNDTTKTVTEKTPKQRKKKASEDKDAQSVKKAAGKRKSTADVVPEELIFDIEDLNDPAVKEKYELGRFDDWAAPSKMSRIEEPVTDRAEPPTPPLTFPETSMEPIVNPEDHGLYFHPANTSEPLSTRTQEKTLATPDDSQKPDIFGQITRAINHESFTSNININSPSKPSGSSTGETIRRNHQANPTWHEKILMYDPIFLEDLAAWLNTKGLSDIGEDREVSAIEVRTWCESRGICCLWKGGWRGSKGGE